MIVPSSVSLTFVMVPLLGGVGKVHVSAVVKVLGYNN